MEMVFIITHSIMAICVGRVVFAIAGETIRQILSGGLPVFTRPAADCCN